ERGRFLLLFGIATWSFSLVFLVLMLWGLFAFLGSGASWLAIGLIAFLGLVSARGVFQGFFAGEVSNMITKRYKRTAVWLLILGGVAAFLCLVPMEDRASGTFQVRAAVRVEMRAPVAGFLREVAFDEGDRVSAGTVVARLEVPDLASRIAQKQAEIQEGRARVRLFGNRPPPRKGARPRHPA